MSPPLSISYAQESRLKQFIELSNLAIELYNSNPENKKIENSFTWDAVISQLAEWDRQGLRIIITGYMAAAYYGLTRASTSIEIIAESNLNCLRPFVQLTTTVNFMNPGMRPLF